MRAMGPGWRHVVMAMDGCTDAHAQLPVDVACELVPPPPRAGFLATRGAQLRWLRDVRPDLVLTYNWGAIESVAAATRLRLPLVHHEDGFLPDEQQRRLRRRSWLRRFLLRATPVIVPSQVLQRIATSEWRLRAANVHHFPNGVDLGRFRPGAPVAASPPDLVVGTVGGLRPEKDHDTLLRAFARLDGKVRLCIVGGGALAEPLRQLAQQLGVAGRVDFVGPVTDTAPWYGRFAVFALSSRTEQMPIAMLEAMACGLPVVATDVGDVKAILPPEAAPCIVPAGDPPALADALQRVLAQAPLRTQLGRANRATAEANHDAARCLQRFLDLYAATARR
jgi:glycosyltransferase involved in cell wall biosynthesis